MKYVKLFLIASLVFLWNIVMWQYYYFDTWWNIYQQWCNETLNVRINAGGKQIKWWRFHLILDPSKIVYYTGSDVSTLRSKFQASTATFDGWSSDSSPSWWEWSSKTILQVDRTNQTTYYTASNGLYMTINFSWKYMDSQYTVNFWMEYDDPEDTTKTTLSKDWGVNVIDSDEQNSRRTWTITILQAPCTEDSIGPTITINQSNNNTLNGATKVNYLSWIKILFTENWWVNTTNDVPYIFDWSNTWTNNNGTISNQYWVDKSTIDMTISCAKCNNWVWKSVHITWWTIAWISYWKTRQNKILNYSGTLESNNLFDFEIEKEVVVTWYVYDNVRVQWLSNAWTWLSGQVPVNFKFNTPVAPTVSFVYPNSSKNTFINLDEDITMYLDDDWAGVDINTVTVYLSWIDNEYSWAYTDLLKITTGSLMWADEWYIVILSWTNHVPFPTSWTIRITVAFEDIEWKSVSSSANTFEFTTRPPCSELWWCCNKMNIEIVTWTFNNYYFVPYGQMTWLTISWSAEFSAEWTWSDEEWWIWTWTITCQTSGLSIYAWDSETNEFKYFTDGDSLVISWEDIVASFDPETNTLVLSKFVWNVWVSAVSPKSASPIRDFEFEWTVLWTWVDENVSGFKVDLYSWDSCDEWTPIWTGYVAWTWVTWMQYTGEALTSLQQYCWKVSAMKGNRAITWSTATFTGMMEIIVKADMWFSDNTTKWMLLMYSPGNHNSPLYSWILWLWAGWTWLFVELVESWCYDVVFKSWNHLASYKLWACTVDWIFDFTVSSWLYNNTTQQIYWDMPSIERVDGVDRFITQDYSVNANDYSAIYSALCWRWNVTAWSYRKVCDIDWNNQITSADAASVVNRLQLSADVFYEWQVFNGFGWFDYNDVWVVPED